MSSEIDIKKLARELEREIRKREKQLALPEQDLEIGTRHLMWMCRQVYSGWVPESLAPLWLGYAQGVLRAGGGPNVKELAAMIREAQAGSAARPSSPAVSRSAHADPPGQSHQTVGTLKFRGITLDVGFEPGQGAVVGDLPTSPGIYAEIHWPRRGVRIGETGRSIRGKIRHDIRWFDSMQDGSAPAEQLRRTIPIAETAKAHGSAGFEFYVVSADSKLDDKALRQACERHLFGWLEAHPDFESWNHQRSWR